MLRAVSPNINIFCFIKIGDGRNVRNVVLIIGYRHIQSKMFVMMYL